MHFTCQRNDTGLMKIFIFYVSLTSQFHFKWKINVLLNVNYIMRHSILYAMYRDEITNRLSSRAADLLKVIEIQFV